MGKSAINGPFSIAMLVYQRVMEMIPLMVHCGIVVYPIYGSYNYGNITIVIVVCCGKIWE